MDFAVALFYGQNKSLMSRTHAGVSLEILSALNMEGVPVQQVYAQLSALYPRKQLYDALFRLEGQGLVAYANPARTVVRLTGDGQAVLSTRRPVRDGVWKIVIFDIPESKRQVRTVVRSQLRAIGFKKWQASIWVTPYALDPKVEQEFAELAKRFFVRLIKTTDINYTKDLEELFEE